MSKLITALSFKYCFSLNMTLIAQTYECVEIRLFGLTPLSTHYICIIQSSCNAFDQYGLNSNGTSTSSENSSPASCMSSSSSL